MKKLTCPQCNKKRSFEATVLKKYFDAEGIAPSKKNIKDYAKSQSWTCNQCIKKGKAKLPNYKKQVHGISGPVKVYMDIPKTCVACQTNFVFSAKEQRYWFEQLKFNPKSSPKTCPKCRTKIRAEKVRKRTLEAEIADLLKIKKMTATELIRLQEIYEELGYTDRYNEISKRLAKLLN